MKYQISIWDDSTKLGDGRNTSNLILSLDLTISPNQLGKFINIIKKEYGGEYISINVHEVKTTYNKIKIDY